ncbi:hypothetical protein pb186bvf_012596 [Paramecium bursaria]
MQRICEYKSCQFFRLQNNNENPKIHRVVCPICVNVQYCSVRCRDLDWPYNHKAVCNQKSIPDRSKSCNDNDDSVSSLTSMRRKPEEFEIIQVGTRTELGKGSYGCVKLVKDKQNGKLYAMKIMNKRSVFDYCSVENLKREIKIQRRLNHAHVCKLFHYFEDKENVYLILEYAENGSLFSYIKKRTKLPENEAFVYFFQTCLGIDYLHKNKIIHRDLKPENLLLDKDGNIKICDFGWSAESLNEKRNTFCGTYEYMAPEMLNKQPHDFSLDVWSLGILLFELMHGHAPYRGKTNEDLIRKIIQGQPIQFSPLVSLEGQNLVRGILKYVPSERFTMKQIFENPWMQKHAQSYNIDIWHFVYQSAQPFRTTPPPVKLQKIPEKPEKPERVVQKKDYPQEINKTDYTDRPIDKHRVTRISQRNEMIQQQQQQQPEQKQYSFIDRKKWLEITKKKFFKHEKNKISINYFLQLILQIIKMILIVQMM